MKTGCGGDTFLLKSRRLVTLCSILKEKQENVDKRNQRTGFMPSEGASRIGTCYAPDVAYKSVVKQIESEKGDHKQEKIK